LPNGIKKNGEEKKEEKERKGTKKDLRRVQPN
jgi:hypothetical protein